MGKKKVTAVEAAKYLNGVLVRQHSHYEEEIRWTANGMKSTAPNVFITDLDRDLKHPGELLPQFKFYTYDKDDNETEYLITVEKVKR